jgi:hypothetical protein
MRNGGNKETKKMNQTVESRELFSEATETTDPQMNAIVERLRKERDQNVGDYKTNGKKWGWTWAKQASYVQLTLALRHHYHDDKDTRLFDEDDKTWGGFVRNCFDSDPLLGRGIGNYFNLATENWVHGWFDGISMFWDEVSEQI